MQYTLAGIRQRVLVDKLDDDEFDPDIVDNFINDTQRDIFNEAKLPFMERIFSGTIPSGSTMFKMPEDISQIQSQTIGGVPGFAGKYLPFRSFFTLYTDIENKPAGPISAWTLYAGNMVVSAPTDKEYVMNMFYIRKPKKLTLDGDIPDVPEEFSELLILGAFKRILERNEDYDLASAVASEYFRIFNLMVERYGERQTSSPIVMGRMNRGL